ncbi:MAG: helix-turn-helix domain-containing protein, partial [Planctomycetota bacterium]|jgi:transcriptional regulator with XRE-family HTH domain
MDARSVAAVGPAEEGSTMQTERRGTGSRKIRDYIRIGHRIAALGNRQRHIAAVLGVSQQTISKKLRGETAILLSDLERLATHYSVPMTYFFEDELDPELSAAIKTIAGSSRSHRDLIVTLGRLSEEKARQIQDITRALD